MKKLFFILIIFLFQDLSFSQGSFTQTTTADFNSNTNIMLNTYNNEMKIACDLGTGLDGDINVTGSLATDNVRTKVAGINLNGQNTINVYSASGFNVNDEILIITSQDINPNLSLNLTGQFEFKRISSISGNTLYLTGNLKYTYDTTGRKHQVLRVPNYNNVTVSGTITCNAWNGNTGGIICFRVKGLLNILNGGSISARHLGYRSGTITLASAGTQGEGITGFGSINSSANVNGGGGGQRAFYNGNYQGAAGGGGGNSQQGQNGEGGYSPPFGGTAGSGFGMNFTGKLFFGGAGGHGGNYFSPYVGGGNGAGIIYIACDSISFQTAQSIIYCDGEIGSYSDAYSQLTGSGGGGAGGPVILISQKTVNIPQTNIMAIGGVGHTWSYWVGGYASPGIIRILAPSITGGLTSPPHLWFFGNVEMYFLYAGSITPAITKTANNGWGTLTYNIDVSPSGTYVSIDILNANGGGLLASNVASGTDLSTIISPLISSIKLRGTLGNSDFCQTPKIYDWTVSWIASTVTLAPTLLLPANNSTNVSLTPLLDCSDVANATNYRFQIALNPSFGTTLFDSSVTSSQINIPDGILSSNVTYYWRACGFNNTGLGPWSATFNFATLSQLPSAPVLLLPANGAINVVLTPALDWSDVSTATKYLLQVALDSLFTNLVINDSSMTVSQYTIPPGLLQNNTKYYWRVRAKNNFGWGNFSVIFSFRTLLPLPTAPVLIQPANNSNTIRTITFKWTVQNAETRKIQISNDSACSNIIKDTIVVPDSVRFSFIPGGTHYWRVAGINASGQGPWSAVWKFTVYPLSVNLYSSEIPKTFELHGNFPNPYNSMTKIRFDIPYRIYVRLAVFDLLGKAVNNIVNDNMDAGKYEFVFNANDLPSGIYFYRIEAGDFIISKKMVLIK